MSDDDKPPHDNPSEDQAAREALYARLGQLDISTYEYNLRRKAIAQGRMNALDVPITELGADPLTIGPATKKETSWGTAAPKRWAARDGRGDDPSVRVVHAPTAAGIGNGKAFLFLWGLKRTRAIDQEMLAREQEKIAEHVERLRAAGYTVVIDPQATKEDFLDAIRGAAEGASGLAPAGILWSAHGFEDGSIECCDGGTVRPQDVDTASVSPDLRLMVFSACYTGARSKTWRTALGGRPLVVGWGRPVTIDRAVDFLTPDDQSDTDLDDLVARYLLEDTPLPDDRTDGYSPVAALTGRLADLPERAGRVAELLHAKWREHAGVVQIWVPLPNERGQTVEAFVVDSAAPFNEGEPLLAVRSEIGEMSGIVEPHRLLASVGGAGYARVCLVAGDELPKLVVQGFLPLSRVRDRDLAALVYEVATLGDALELQVFGSNRY